MDISVHIKSGIKEAFKSLYDHELASEAISLQPTRKEFQGSHTFVTFAFAKISRKNPVATGVG